MTAPPPPRLGELFHIGWVVRDCEAAQEELRTRLGAGPFLSTGDELCFDQVLVHGKPVPVSLKIAFGALGGVLIELLQPLDDRSPHAEFLAERGEGMHHLAFLVTDFDEQLAAAREGQSGADPAHRRHRPGKPVPRGSTSTGRNASGTVIELWERTPQSEALLQRRPRAAAPMKPGFR